MIGAGCPHIAPADAAAPLQSEVVHLALGHLSEMPLRGGRCAYGAGLRLRRPMPLRGSRWRGAAPSTTGKEAVSARPPCTLRRPGRAPSFGSGGYSALVCGRHKVTSLCLSGSRQRPVASPATQRAGRACRQVVALALKRGWEIQRCRWLSSGCSRSTLLGVTPQISRARLWRVG